MSANIYRRLTEMERRLRGFAEGAAARMVRWSSVATSSGDGQDDAVRNLHPDEDEEDAQLAVRRVAPWGVAGRPPAGVLAAVVHALGGAASGLLVGVWTNRYGPQSLETGETALYCSATGTTVKLDKDGNVLITAGAGASVTVNGGSQRVARAGDPVDGGTVTATVGGAPVTFSYVPSGGGAPVVGSSVTLNGGRITDGAPNFKG
jgi:hypothetical protein